MDLEKKVTTKISWESKNGTAIGYLLNRDII